ncbi:Flp family type IVb pilin [Paramixta manurensis]|uniref:Flp family type IVb pilin n=1 Tax=Paramixta manurensis TaxID=2740817 RepID=A0A6M8UNF6_9GAMM|nr:Flp family type IVb pilin [Erwiniaceae bacterium PD-1]
MKNVILLTSVKLTNNMVTLRNKAAEFVKRQDGVTAIEYAVIAVAISGMLMVVFGSEDGSFIKSITDKFSVLTDNINNTVNQ